MEGLVQSVHRAATLLDALAARPESPLGELSRSAKLHPATARRLLLTLEAVGYVQQDPVSRTYRLGPKLMYLGRRAAQQMPLRDMMLEEIRRLAHESRETVYIAILHGNDVLYVETAQSPQSVRLSTSAGDYAPAYSTATGRVLLAYLPHEQLSQYLEQEFEPETPFTVTDKKQLGELIAEARISGFSITIDEREIGVTGIAVPILYQDGVPQAALAIAGPTFRIPPSRREELVRLCLESTLHGGAEAEVPSSTDVHTQNGPVVPSKEVLQI